MTVDPARMSDEDMATHMASLTDDQLSDFLAAIDAAEIIGKAKNINHGDAALWYVTVLGWPVFPLKARGKQPLIGKAHPNDSALQQNCRGRCGAFGHGFKDATTDINTVKGWWTRWPEANIGVPTGQKEAGGCGLDVIDVDGRLGLNSLATLKHSHCPPNCTAETFCTATGPLPPVVARAFTPGDPSEAAHEPGRHLFTPAIGSGNTAGALPGIDLRGNGGYVVVAPSVGPSGARYSWITRPTT